MTTIIYTPEETIRFKKELKDLVVKHTKVFARMITARGREYLFEFINNQTPMLQDSFYKLSTKIWWILNDLTDFPTCQHCGKKLVKLNAILSTGYQSFCSIKCSSNTKSVRDKYKTTCIKKYGVENPYQSELIKDKKRITWMKKYGVTNPGCSVAIKDKIKATCMKNYGVDHVFKTKNVKDKIKVTILEKFGVKHQCQAQAVKDKITATHMARHGVKYPMQSDLIQAKIKSTSMKRYGVEYFMQNHDIRCKATKKYRYQDITFDSKPEIALYIYLIDHNITFEYQPKMEFWYESIDKSHKYMPDFKIEDTYVEIKGDQFLNKETGHWVNPWNHDLDYIYEAKRQCCLNNNVKILYSDDYQKYLDYVNDKYGKEYLHRFKTV